MLSIKIKSNVDQVLAGLEKLGLNSTAFATRILEEVGDEAGPLFQNIQQFCPSPTSLMWKTDSTGFLRDSHIFEILSPFTAMLRPTAYYATFVHEGTVNMPARPWLLMALGLTEPQIEGLLDALLAEYLEENLGGITPPA